MLRHCKHCNLEKPYEPTAPSQRKASGFYNGACWDCHILLQRPSKTTDPLKAAKAAQVLALKIERAAYKAQIIEICAQNRLLKQQQTALRDELRAECDRKFRVKNAEYLAHLEQVLQRKYGTQGTKDSV